MCAVYKNKKKISIISKEFVNAVSQFPAWKTAGIKKKNKKGKLNQKHEIKKYIYIRFSQLKYFSIRNQNILFSSPIILAGEISKLKETSY